MKIEKLQVTPKQWKWRIYFKLQFGHFVSYENKFEYSYKAKWDNYYYNFNKIQGNACNLIKQISVSSLLL